MIENQVPKVKRKNIFIPGRESIAGKPAIQMSQQYLPGFLIFYQPNSQFLKLSAVDLGRCVRKEA